MSHVQEMAIVRLYLKINVSAFSHFSDRRRQRRSIMNYDVLIIMTNCTEEIWQVVVPGIFVPVSTSDTRKPSYRKDDHPRVPVPQYTHGYFCLSNALR